MLAPFLCKPRATWNEVGLYLCWKEPCASLTLKSVDGKQEVWVWCVACSVACGVSYVRVRGVVWNAAVVVLLVCCCVLVVFALLVVSVFSSMTCFLCVVCQCCGSTTTQVQCQEHVCAEITGWTAGLPAPIPAVPGNGAADITPTGTTIPSRSRVKMSLTRKRTRFVFTDGRETKGPLTSRRMHEWSKTAFQTCERTRKLFMLGREKTGNVEGGSTVKAIILKNRERFENGDTSIRRGHESSRDRLTRTNG